MRITPLRAIAARAALLVAALTLTVAPGWAQAGPTAPGATPRVGTAAVQSKVWFSQAIAGYNAQDVCGVSNCQKFTIKVSCKLRTKACLNRREVKIWNKNPFGDNVWRVIWSGRTNQWGTARTRWIGEDEWYYTYCCDRVGNPIKLTVGKKTVTSKGKRTVFAARSRAGEVSYRRQDLSS